MIAPWDKKQTIVIDLDKSIIEVVKNGKHYSLNEYLAMAIENLLDLRMKEDGNG